MPDNSGSFRFFPRPEAHSMNWNALLPPVQRAVRDLLLRLDGAVREADYIFQSDRKLKHGKEVVNCFLVYGVRGTGKTTVLLSTKNAVLSDTDSFFDDKKNPDEPEREKNLRKDAIRYAEELKKTGIVWLKPLDLEPLPPDANLLTTLLTRVLKSLDTSEQEQYFPETKSILEEGADSARQKLSRLINNATLMWEDIDEKDTRSRANRQVAAADIYARFRQDFVDAMATLSHELGRSHSSRGKCCPMVLPIDNIDRSTDHLYAIVKLAQMVSCSYLWLVMAGDRQDVDTFLERGLLEGVDSYRRRCRRNRQNERRR